MRVKPCPTAPNLPKLTRKRMCLLIADHARKHHSVLMKGMYPPEEWPEFEKDLKRATEKLNVALDQLSVKGAFDE